MFNKLFKKHPDRRFSSLSGSSASQASDTELATKGPLEPHIRSHYAQPRNDLAGFFSALREAAERFDMTHIAPLAGLDNRVRFQLRTIAVKATPDNDKLLHELQVLPPQILKTAALNCLRQAKCADHFDLREFFGVMVTAGDEVAAGEAVTTLATIGVERINLDFEFDGEHLSAGPGADPAGASGHATGLALRLRHRDGRVEALPAEHFPLVIGTSPTADIRVEGSLVSREHATLYYDAELGRAILQDHSRHGVWFNGERLGRDGRAILAGSGRFTLSSPMHADAPVIEFSHAALDHLNVTPLTAPPDEYNRPVPANVSLIEPRPSLAAEAPAATASDSRVPRRTSAPADKTETLLRAPNTRSPADSALYGLSAAAASETQLAPATGSKAMAYLQARYDGGTDVHTVPITELPFIIGREPRGAGYAVADQATYVSREHLCLTSFHHGHFEIKNAGLGRNNTYKQNALQDVRFLCRPVSPASDKGWMVLGGRALDEKCVEVRLIDAPPRN